MNDRKKITPAFLAEGTEKEVREAVWPKRFILRQTLGAKKPDPPTPKTAEGRELAGKAFWQIRILAYIPSTPGWNPGNYLRQYLRSSAGRKDDMEITMSNAGPRLSAILKEWGNRFSFPKKSKAAPAGGLETVAEQAANDVPSPLAEAMGARLARYGYRSLALGLGGVFMVFVTGPFDDHFTKLAKEDVLGNVYREAKSHSLAVAKATDFKSLKEKSAELKIWSDKQGKEHLALKPGGKLEDVHALMHVSILLDSGIEDFNKGAQDENFTAYKLKKAASDFPTNAFMKEKSTLESVKWKWILSLTLLIAVTLSAYSYFSEKAKKPDGGRTSSAAAMIGGLIGGLIGGSLVAALYVNYALGNLIG